MQVRARTASGIPHQSNDLPLSNELTWLYIDPAVMPITRQSSIKMADFNKIAIATIAPSRKNNPAISSSKNGGTNVIGNVNSAMLPTPTPTVT
jgi:hypothetical protein